MRVLALAGLLAPPVACVIALSERERERFIQPALAYDDASWLVSSEHRAFGALLCIMLTVLHLQMSPYRTRTLSRTQNISLRDVNTILCPAHNLGSDSPFVVRMADVFFEIEWLGRKTTGSAVPVPAVAY